MSDSLCQDGKHEWKQVYYGDECIKCGLFYVDGLAPWLMEDDDEDDDPGINRTCETCGGEFWDGGTSCDCDRDIEELCVVSGRAGR